jgi:hypothetical protein
MKLINTKEVVSVTRTEKYSLGDGFFLHVIYFNGEIRSQAIKSNIRDIRIKYARDKFSFLAKAASSYFHTKWWSETDYIVQDECYKEYFENHEFNKDQIFLISIYDHTIKNWAGEDISQLWNIDYVGGGVFRQKDRNDDSGYIPDWDWEKLGGVLRAHPLVYNLNEMEIQHYNRDFYGQKAYEFDMVAKESLCSTEILEVLNLNMEELTRKK